jgi:hypothetical protein
MKGNKDQRIKKKFTPLEDDAAALQQRQSPNDD